MGVLDLEKYEEEVYKGTDPQDAPCVMSAVLAAGKPALTYQTWKHWASASVVTRMRVLSEDLGYTGPDLSSGKSAFKSFHSPENDENKTIYGFIAPYQDPVTGKYILLPVPNIPDAPPWITVNDPFYGVFQYIGGLYWHCSKTAWYVYFASGFTKGIYNPTGIPDLENNDWYFRPGVNIKTFGFFKLYVALLRLEGKSWEEAISDAEREIVNAIQMVAIPDEIRFATTDPFYGEGGPLDESSRKTWGPWGQYSEKLLKLF